MSDEHKEEFETILDEYIIPGTAYPLDAWTTEDLVRFAELIDIELQERAWHAEQQANDN